MHLSRLGSLTFSPLYMFWIPIRPSVLRSTLHSASSRLYPSDSIFSPACLIRMANRAERRKIQKIQKKKAAKGTEQVIATSTKFTGKLDTIIVTETPASSQMSDKGTSEAPTPSSMTSFPSTVFENQEKLYAKQPIASQWPIKKLEREPGFSKWIPWRTYRWTRDFVTALCRLCTGERWLDALYSLGLLACFICCLYITVEGLLHLIQGVAAQEADCSIVYVTIPGPIVTVSLVGQTPTDPNHGTYYYSVVNGTTRWLDSIAPPTPTRTLSTTIPNFTPTPSSPGQPSAPGVPPPGNPLSTSMSYFLDHDLG